MIPKDLQLATNTTASVSTSYCCAEPVLHLIDISSANNVSLLQGRAMQRAKRLLVAYVPTWCQWLQVPAAAAVTDPADPTH